MGHTERYRMRGTINKIAQRVVSVVQFSLETYPANFLLQPLWVTEGDVVHYIDNKSFAYKIIVCTFAADNRNV